MDTNTEKITMRGVIWRKLVEWVDDHELDDLGRALVKAFIAGLLSAAVINERLLDHLLQWRGGTLPLLLWVWAIVYGLPPLVRMLADSMPRRETAEEEIEYEEAGDTVEGIPRAALRDHLLRAGTFKLADAERKWSVPRYRYTALVKRLKELEVLTHGANNATVLKEGIKAAELDAILSSGTTAAELERPVRIVRPLPSPTPLFTKKAVSLEETLEETAPETVAKPVRNLCVAA